MTEGRIGHYAATAAHSAGVGLEDGFDEPRELTYVDMDTFRATFCVPADAGSGNCLCAKGLRRRFKTPEKHFSGELSNGPNLALFETAAAAKPLLFQGGRVTQGRE